MRQARSVFRPPRSCLVALVAVLLGSAGQAEATTPTWDSVAVPGGSAAFRCVAGLPQRIPRARLLIALGERLLDVGEDDPLIRRLSIYSEWLKELQRKAAAARVTRDLSLNDGKDRSAAEDLFEHIGLRLRTRSASRHVEVLQRDTEVARIAACAVGAPAELAKRLSVGERIALLSPEDRIPLPIAATVWTTAVGEGRPSDQIFHSIISDKTTLLVYTGLASLDAETAAFVTASPQLVRSLPDVAVEFAAYAAAFRVRGGRVDVPGGTPLVSAWERLLGRSHQRPAEFMRELFRADDGRFAHFYATLDTFDRPRLQALLGSGRDDARALFDLAVDSLGEWRPRMRKAGIPAMDGLTAARELTLTADGRPAGPRSRRLWRAALEADELPTRPERVLRGSVEEPVTAVWLLTQVFESAERRAERFAAVRFAQRLATAVPTATDEDILVAIVAFRRYPALMLGIERLGARDVKLMVRVARSAQRITGGNPADNETALRQWQAAFALVEALRRTGAATAPQAAVWIDALASWQQEQDAAFGAALTAWIESDIRPLLPAASGEPGDSAGDEVQLYRLISGPVSSAPQTFEWEGQTYAVDLARAQAKRASALARRQPRPLLDDVLALARAAKLLASATRKVEVERVVETLRTVPRLEAPLPRRNPADDPVRPDEVLRTIVKDLSRTKQDRDVKRARKALPRLRALVDELVADVLTAVVYNGRLGAATGPIELYIDLWRRHDLGLVMSRPQLTLVKLWQLPIEDSNSDRGKRLQGSIIGLDIGLGSLLIRVVPGSNRLPSTAPMHALVAATTAQLVTLLSGASEDAAGLRRAVAALDRGRAKWSAALAGRTVPDLPISARRWQVVEWMLAHEPTAVGDEFTATEFAVLGALPEATVAGRPFGVSEIPYDGCWCLKVRPPPELPLRGEHDIAAALGDLALHVAPLAVELRMPVNLLQPLIAAALGDVVGMLDPTSSGDWRSVVHAINSIDRNRIEQLLFSLVQTGELAVATSAR